MNDLELDVRPMLRNGGEPFAAIMSAVEKLAPHQRLRLYATFKPEPLFRVLGAQGFTYEATPLEDGEWSVLFTPTIEKRVIDIAENAHEPEYWPDPVRDLDCTDMDPPEPMVQVLATLEQMEPGEVLFVLLGREPLFLFPELKARGHAFVGQFDETGTTYRMMIRTGSASDK